MALEGSTYDDDFDVNRCDADADCDDDEHCTTMLRDYQDDTNGEMCVELSKSKLGKVKICNCCSYLSGE